MKLSVIIVSYNAVEFLDACLNSIQKNSIPDLEVIVWDNDSIDKNILKLEPKYPQFQFIFHHQNLGFSKGNNQAVAKASGEYVLILNPDTLVYPHFFESILNFAENHPKMGAAGVRMIDVNGSFLPESKRNVPNILNSISKIFKFNINESKPYYATHIKEDEVAEVEVLTGACMLMKKEVYQKVGGFDERYFMYGEDIDLSYTLLQKGYQNFYVGSIILLHHKGESTIKDKKYLDRFYGAMQLFIQKYEKPHNIFTYYLAFSGIKFKYWIELLKLKFTQKQQ